MPEMPEIRRMKVTVVAEIKIDGVQTFGEAVDEAVKPIEALKGVKIVSATVDRLT